MTIPAPAAGDALKNQLVRLNAERDALRAALADTTHDYQPGPYGCTFCLGIGPDMPIHNTPAGWLRHWHGRPAGCS